jgi:hypothetical protein
MSDKLAGIIGLVGRQVEAERPSGMVLEENMAAPKLFDKEAGKVISRELGEISLDAIHVSGPNRK